MVVDVGVCVGVHAGVGLSGRRRVDECRCEIWCVRAHMCGF